MQAVFLSGQAALSGGFEMRAGPGRRGFLGGRAADLQAFSWRPAGFSWRTMPKQNILFERFSAANTKSLQSTKHNHIKLNHRSPAIAVFYPSTRLRLMQADAGFLNHVQAGRLLTQAGPGRS
jgi:hypothetical protein